MRSPSLVLAALVGVVPAGCNRGAPAPTTPPPAPPQVSVVKPQQRAVKRVVEQPGTVQAFEETALFAKIPGYVGAVADDPNKKAAAEHDRQIDIGSRVKIEQPLASLVVPELEQELKQKRALVDQATAEVTQAEKFLLSVGAAVTAAKALVTESDAGVERAQAVYDRAQLEVNRIKKQVAGGFDNSQTLDDAALHLAVAGAARKEAAAKVTSAKAAVGKAEADRDKAAADVDAATAKLEVAKAEVGRVKELVAYTTIKAPFDGIVTRRAVSPGAFVGPAERAALFSVAKIDPVRVVVHVPEADAGLVAAGQDVAVVLQAVPGPPATGKLTRTSWSLEPGSRTLRAEIDLPNPDGRVRPGMYVYARLTAEIPSAWAVPAAAIGKVGDDSVAYLVEGGKAVRVAVQLGRGDGQFTQIRRLKRPGASDWTDVTGAESIATPAGGLADGQSIAPP